MNERGGGGRHNADAVDVRHGPTGDSATLHTQSRREAASLSICRSARPGLTPNPRPTATHDAAAAAVAGPSPQTGAVMGHTKTTDRAARPRAGWAWAGGRRSPPRSWKARGPPLRTR
jgi:hypothetical protein